MARAADSGGVTTAPDTTELPALLGVVGTSAVVANSLSPRMMGAALAELGIDGSYVPLAVDREPELALRGIGLLGFTGCNVTMPYKQVAAAIADHRSPEVERTGAANTLVVHDDGTIAAAATDGRALVEACAAHDVELAGADVLIVGAGGVAVEAAVACIDVGVRRMHVVNRTRDSAVELARKLHVIAPALELQVHERVPIREAVHVVVGCVPAPAVQAAAYAELAGDPSFVDYAYVRSGGPTPMMVAAADRGAAHVDGRELLVRQGAAALRVWFGVEPPIEVMSRAVR